MFVGLLGSALMNGARRRVIEVAVVGGVTGAALAAYFLAVVAPNLNDKLRAYWASQYLTGFPRSRPARRVEPARPARHLVGMPAVVFVALFVCGIVVLVRLGACVSRSRCRSSGSR